MMIEISLSGTVIGKSCPPYLYVHKQYKDTIPKRYATPEQIETAIQHVPASHKWNVLKLSSVDHSISFINSPDFDTSPEPISGDSCKVTVDGNVKITKQAKDPKIWHHKWQWVGDDYTGFNIPEAKQRSQQWQKLMGKHLDTEGRPLSKTRIGTKSYWENNVVPLLE